MTLERSEGIVLDTIEQPAHEANISSTRDSSVDHQHLPGDEARLWRQ